MNKRFFIIGLLPLFLVAVPIGDGEGQVLDRGKAEALLTRLERSGEGMEELLAMGDEITPLLLGRLEDQRPTARRTALDLFGRIDLHDDGVVNRDEVIDAMVRAIDRSEPSEVVIDTALRYLQRLDPGKATPSMMEALLTQLQHGQARAARVLGRVGDPSLRPVLEPYVTSPDKAVAELTRQALAKIGDQHYLAEILAELDAEDGRVRAEAFQKLAYIGNRATVQKIVRFLWDLGPPASADPHVRFVSHRSLAAWALSQIVDNPPVKKDLAALYTEEDVQAWRAWWEAHQNEYP